jgi:hypothetical protein
MSAKPKKKTVALGTSKLSVPQLIALSRHIVTSMTGNAHFTNPTPLLATITTQVNLVESDYNVTLTRVKGSVSKMRAEEKTLVSQLKALAAYVEDVANSDPDHASDIIASAGMPEKKAQVRMPKTFTAVPGKLKGSVLLDTKAVRESAYIYQMTTDLNTPASWVTIYTGTKVKFTKTGLTSATHYYFRVAVSTKGLQGDWSSPMDTVVL